MITRPNALHLADLIDGMPYSMAHEAAAELRRLYALNQELLDVLTEIVALWDHHCYAHGDGQPSSLHIKASTAIAKAEESK